MPVFRMVQALVLACLLSLLPIVDLPAQAATRPGALCKASQLGTITTFAASSLVCKKVQGRYVWVFKSVGKQKVFEDVPDWNGYVQPSVKIDKIIGCRPGPDGPNVVLRMKVYGGNAVITHTPIVDLDRALNGGWLSGNDPKAYGNQTYSKIDATSSAYLYLRVTGSRYFTYGSFNADLLSVPFNYKNLRNFTGKIWRWDPYFGNHDPIPGQPIQCPFMDESPATQDVPPPPKAPFPSVGDWSGYEEPSVLFDKVLACKKLPPGNGWAGQTAYAVRLKLSGGNAVESLASIIDMDKYLLGEAGGVTSEYTAINASNSAYGYTRVFSSSGFLLFREIDFWGISVPFNYSQLSLTWDAVRKWRAVPYPEGISKIPGSDIACS